MTDSLEGILSQLVSVVPCSMLSSLCSILFFFFFSKIFSKQFIATVPCSMLSSVCSAFFFFFFFF